MSTSKVTAKEAVQRKDWSTACALYEQVLAEYKDGEVDALDLAKVYANLSFVALNLERFDEAIEHGRRSTELAPQWGKGHARLGAALEASGRLLEANEKYQIAMSTGFTACRLAHEQLNRNPRFRKLLLIREASAQEHHFRNIRGQVITLTERDTDPAILAMNEEQRKLLRMIEQGRVLPESTTSAEILKEQDLILYLAAVDASIVQGHIPGRRNPALCPGTRRWVLSKALSECNGFDIYHDLFHIRDDEPAEYDRYWYKDNRTVEQDRICYTILLAPNRECDKIVPETAKWGPTVWVEVREFWSEPLSESQVHFSGTYLMGLRHWVMVQCATKENPFGGIFLTPNGEHVTGAFEWDASQQQMVNNYGRLAQDPTSFYETAMRVSRHFATTCSPRPEDIPEDLYFFNQT